MRQISAILNQNIRTNRIPMELAALKTFLHVAATGSFSRAAALERSTQSAISKRIGMLEYELAARLFERTGRGARLTDAGRLLLPRAEALTAEADGLADLIRGGRDTPRGSVRIAIQPSVGWPLIGDLVTATQGRYPGIRLQIAEGTTGQIEEWLTDGRLDLGVLSTAPPHVDAQPLFVVPSLLVGRVGDPEVRRASLPFARLATLPIVIATMPNGGRLLIEEEARRRGIALNVVLEVNSIHLIKRLVARGGCYTLASPPAVAAEIAAGELGAVRIVRPQILQTFYLAIGGRRPVGAAVSALATIIRELTLPRGRGPQVR
jgi:LysR family nitrogen assimilation transcriptional regulator